VRRILATWNIGPSAAVFVDDNPRELEEVKAAFPEIECVLFPKGNSSAAEQFFFKLREFFAKSRLSTEDALRQESVRRGAEFEEELNNSQVEEQVLSGLNARLSVDKEASADPRSLELVNKTNQFNLNGRRFEAHEWQKHAERSSSFVWSVAYEDKFGPLGRIAVLQGTTTKNTLELETWVMSCRAFSRRIEHYCIHLLFEETKAEHILFNFEATARNGPMELLLTEMLGQAPCRGTRLTRKRFRECCPVLYQGLQWTQKKATSTHG